MDEQHPRPEGDLDAGPPPGSPASPQGSDGVASAVPQPPASAHEPDSVASAVPEVPAALQEPAQPMSPGEQAAAAAPGRSAYAAPAPAAATPDTAEYAAPAPAAAGYPAAAPSPGAPAYPAPGAPEYAAAAPAAAAPGAAAYPAPGAAAYPAPGAPAYPAPGAPDYPAPGATPYPSPMPGAAGPESVAPAAPEPPRRRRSVGAIVTICLLSVGLVLALGAGAWLVYEYLQAKELISDQQQEIEDQREMIEQKEEFGAAMSQLLDTTQKFDGALTGSIVPWATYERFADQAYTHRRDPERLARDVASINAENIKLEQVWNIAQQELATNATGTEYEAVIDRLGGGLVSSVIDNDLCGGTEEALGCVHGDDPYLVHFGAGGHAEPYMTDDIRTGIAYHEFAHVLQFTNPTETADAVKAFDGDLEVMADCYAFAYLPGWSLDHTVWVSDYEYWEVSVGYGVTCTEEQRQVIRDWNDSLGVELQTIGG